jgi:hypothetical protein
VDVLTNPPALEETAIWAFELALARIRLGVSCVERTPSLGRLRPRSAALNARKHRDYQGKVGATGFEPATFRPPAERIQVSMCLGASVASYVSRAVDDLDR